MSQHMSQTPQHLEEDVLAHFQQSESVEPGKYGAINWGNLAQNVKKIVVEVGPIVETFTPPQYAAIVKAIVAAVSLIQAPQS